jgi:hypothetical protein
MDLNELRGRVIKVNLARPMKGPAQLGGNRAGESISPIRVRVCLEHISSSMGVRRVATTKFETSFPKWRLVTFLFHTPSYVFMICAGNQARTNKQGTQEDDAEQDEAMEE